MAKFNVGDRVRVVENKLSSPNDDYFRIGDVGTVIEVDEPYLGEADLGQQIFVQFDEHHNDDGRWYVYSTELEAE